MARAIIYLERPNKVTEHLGVIDVNPRPEKGLRVRFMVDDIEETGIVETVDPATNPDIPYVRIIADHPRQRPAWQSCMVQLRDLCERSGGNPREEARAIVQKYLAPNPDDRQQLEQHLMNERDRHMLVHVPTFRLAALSRLLAVVESALATLKQAPHR